MQADPTVERIRQIRHKISEECGHDPKKLVKYYTKYQQRFSGRLIRTPKVASMATLSSNTA